MNELKAGSGCCGTCLSSSTSQADTGWLLWVQEPGTYSKTLSLNQTNKRLKQRIRTYIFSATHIPSFTLFLQATCHGKQKSSPSVHSILVQKQKLPLERGILYQLQNEEPESYSKWMTGPSGTHTSKWEFYMPKLSIQNMFGFVFSLFIVYFICVGIEKSK